MFEQLNRSPLLCIFKRCNSWECSVHFFRGPCTIQGRKKTSLPRNRTMIVLWFPLKMMDKKKVSGMYSSNTTTLIWCQARAPKAEKWNAGFLKIFSSLAKKCSIFLSKRMRAFPEFLQECLTSATKRTFIYILLVAIIHFLCKLDLNVFNTAR